MRKIDRMIFELDDEVWAIAEKYCGQGKISPDSMAACDEFSKIIKTNMLLSRGYTPIAD
jgi:hypothetical protein